MKRVVVIGAGPAGMMAAGRAAECGAEVVLLEKTNSLGNKLLITGKDRCNFTNSNELDIFIRKFGNKGNFLYPAFYNFFNEDLVNFFETLGVRSKIERGGRIFPVSDSAEDIQKALLKYIKNTGVQVITGNKVKDVIKRNGRVCGVRTEKGIEFRESNKKSSLPPFSVILCTGGMSYPGTGSTGDGYRIAQKLGHTIVPLRPALVPLETKEEWPKKLSGLSLENIRAIARASGRKIAEEFGDMLFTHFGVSGPVILSMSKIICRALERGNVIISIDLKPALSFEKLDLRIQRDFQKYSNKIFSNCLNDLLPKSLIPVIVKLSCIPEGKPVHSITRQERLNLVKLLKELSIEIVRTRPIAEAIVTSGGISLEEVDNHTMESKIVKGLYFAGEILDLDGPTGGYNLQMAFSTGRLAGESAAGLKWEN